MFDQATLIKFLNQAFDSEGIDIFCMSYFDEAFDKVEGEISKNRKIIALITYCKQHLKMPQLHQRLREERKAMFEEFETKYAQELAENDDSFAEKRREQPVDELISKLRTWVAQNKLKKALQEIQSYCSTIEHEDAKDISGAAILLLGQLAQLEHDKNMNLIAADRAGAEKTRIDKATLELIQKLEDL